jgi:hypothetical protein
MDKLLKEVNATIIITLVPKNLNPFAMSEFRQISSCNVIYKCITKILVDRLLPGLDEIINPHQTAFIANRSIKENVLLSQKVVKNYHRKRETTMYYQGKPDEVL